MCLCWFFFFKQKTAYEMRISDWSSDVCSSDLVSPACGRPSDADDLLVRRQQEAIRGHCGRWQSRPRHEARRLPDCLRPALDEIIRRQPGWILLGTANESHELGTAFYIPSRRSVLIVPFDHDIAAEDC